MGDHSHYLQPQNLMYNGYLQLSGSAQQTNQNTSIVQMRTLREQLNQTNAERDQLQKELNVERQQKIQLQSEFQKAVQAQQELNYQCMTLRLEVAKYQQHQHFQSLQQTGIHSSQSNQHFIQQSNQTIKTEDIKQEVTQVCDECQFETKSQVSLFIHKLNHSLGSSTPRHLHLPTRVFTTKSEGIVNFSYKCPSCDESSPLARHEIYPHIYQFHSSEQPHKCPICLLYFTHSDYLAEHKLDKHKMGVIDSPGVSSGRGRGRGGRTANSQSRTNSKNSSKSLISSPVPTKQSVIQTPYGAVKQESGTASTPGNSGPNSGSADTSGNKRKAEDSPDIICISENPSKQMSVQKTTTITIAKDDDELSCSYPGCGFTAPSRDRLQFHMSAHTMSKYKCPYCAYGIHFIIYNQSIIDF